MTIKAMSRVFMLTAVSTLSSFSLIFGQGVAHTAHEQRISALQAQISVLDDDHCEVPCGIYGDSLRIELMHEHIRTIEKGISQINELSAEGTPNYNQLVRWIMNKEHHATEIQTIVSQYFLHQRVKMPKKDLAASEMQHALDKYNGQLHTLHAMQVAAMKCKQTTDQKNVDMLRSALEKFDHWYFHGHSH